jgi:hypothetical protein
MYRELKKLYSQKKPNDPVKKWATELNRAYPKEEVQIAKKHMKNAYHPWKIKTTLRFHLTPVRIASIKTTTNNKYW